MFIDAKILGAKDSTKRPLQLSESLVTLLNEKSAHKNQTFAYTSIAVWERETVIAISSTRTTT